MRSNYVALNRDSIFLLGRVQGVTVIGRTIIGTIPVTEIANEILAIRRAVREHRDQIGDYRCWVDDEVLYRRTLPEMKDAPMVLPNPEEFHRRCELYFELRQDPDEASREIPLDSSVGPLNLNYAPELDVDLASKTHDELRKETSSWHKMIRVHQELGYEKRTFKDDRALYLELPEKILAITRLPDRTAFLGRNCPSYNAHCQIHPEDYENATWSK